MIIGIDASRANHEQKTGVEWYAFSVIEEMKKVKIETKIKIVLYSDVPLKGELAILPPNWTSKVLRWPPKRLWTQVRMSWEMLWHAPDVLFIPAHVFPILHPKKTVMTIHDVAAMRFPESYNWFERWYSLFSAKMALKKLWKIIVPSEFTGRELKKLEIRNWKLRDNVTVVPHGYDSRYKKIATATAGSRPEGGKNKIKIEEVVKKYRVEKPFIMTIGRLEEKKNTIKIIEAFNILRLTSYNLHLLLVGSPGHGYEKVKEAIDKSPFKNDIITPGWVGPDDVPYLMNAASVFVFPSLYEGFGIPVLEAMACGVPVVASCGNSLEEVGGDAALSVDPQKPEEIASAVQRLMTDEVLRQEKIRLGFERVKQFSWEKTARETMRILMSE